MDFVGRQENRLDRWTFAVATSETNFNGGKKSHGDVQRAIVTPPLPLSLFFSPLHVFFFVPIVSYGPRDYAYKSVERSLQNKGATRKPREWKTKPEPSVIVELQVHRIDVRLIVDTAEQQQQNQIVSVRDNINVKRMHKTIAYESHNKAIL